MQNIVQHNYIKLFVVIRNFIFFSIHTRGINEFWPIVACQIAYVTSARKSWTRIHIKRKGNKFHWRDRKSHTIFSDLYILAWNLPILLCYKRLKISVKGVEKDQSLVHLIFDIELELTDCQAYWHHLIAPRTFNFVLQSFKCPLNKSVLSNKIRYNFFTIRCYGST